MATLRRCYWGCYYEQLVPCVIGKLLSSSLALCQTFSLQWACTLSSTVLCLCFSRTDFQGTAKDWRMSSVDLRIACLIFASDVFLLALSDCELHHFLLLSMKQSAPNDLCQKKVCYNPMILKWRAATNAEALSCFFSGHSGGVQQVVKSKCAYSGLIKLHVTIKCRSCLWSCQNL